MEADADPAEAKARIRALMRARRRRLGRSAVAEAGAAACEALARLTVVSAGRRLAAYKAVRGEIPLDALTESELPDVFTFPRVAGEDLEFVAHHRGQAFSRGSFGIPEPVSGETVALADHDAVLVPLTAFDERCQRVGQGGGFYDRALAVVSALGRRPLAIGVAHEFQRVEKVPTEPWDVALDAVVTDAGMFISSPRVEALI